MLRHILFVITFPACQQNTDIFACTLILEYFQNWVINNKPRKDRTHLNLFIKKFKSLLNPCSKFNKMLCHVYYKIWQSIFKLKFEYHYILALQHVSTSCIYWPVSLNQSIIKFCFLKDVQTDAQIISNSRIGSLQKIVKACLCH